MKVEIRQDEAITARANWCANVPKMALAKGAAWVSAHRVEQIRSEILSECTSHKRLVF